MKKKPLTRITTALLVLMVVCIVAVLYVLFNLNWRFHPFFDFLYPTELQFWDGGEQISSVSSADERTAFVTENGEVYIAGDPSLGVGIPLSQKRVYEHYGRYVMIFDKAVRSVNLGNGGGTLLTNDGRVFVFSVYVDEFNTPTELACPYAEKIKVAHLSYRDVYVLTEAGVFYRQNLEDLTDVERVCDGISDVKCSNTNLDMYMLFSASAAVAIYYPHGHLAQQEYSAFDAVYCNDENYAYIAPNGTAHIYLEGEEVATLANAMQIAPYGEGIAVLCVDGKVYFYGRERLSSGEKLYFGLCIAEGVSSIAGNMSAYCLGFVNADGELCFYGISKHASWGTGADRFLTRYFETAPHCVQ